MHGLSVDGQVQVVGAGSAGGGLALLYTLAKHFGMDMVHVGVLMTANLAIALYTPPVGGTLFVAAKLAHAGIGEEVTFLGAGSHFQLWEPEAAIRRVAEARARCPGIVIVESRPEVYIDYHRRLKSCRRRLSNLELNELYSRRRVVGGAVRAVHRRAVPERGAAAGPVPGERDMDVVAMARGVTAAAARHGRHRTRDLAPAAMAATSVRPKPS